MQAQLAQPVPDLDLELPDTRPVPLSRIWVDNLTVLPNHRWTVVVGVLTDNPAAPSYYEVPVQTDDLGAVALTLPARTVGPVKAPTGDLDAAVTTSLSLSDPASIAASGYLAALTAGTGDIDRWISPDASLAAIAPPPCRTVKVQQVQTTADPVPAPTTNGAELGVLVTAACTAPSARGATPALTLSQYPLLLRARGSRWEVAQNNPSLTQPSSTEPSSTEPSIVQTSPAQPNLDPNPTATTSSR